MKRLLGLGLLFMSWIFSVHVGAFQELLILDQRCTVSVLNRTVQANEQGRFVLNNVPSTLGRVRATCEFEEGIVSGETDYFSLVTNSISGVGDFYRANARFTPVDITIANAKPVVLTSIGSTVALQVRAQYADNSTKIVSDPRFGTNYLSSNSSVASVDNSGVVTSISVGTALVTVRKDGVVAIVAIVIATTGDSDSDGDGIPDDIELAVSLNPNDPIDALEDADSDGLSNRDEYSLGTGINNPDSDNNGVSDNLELQAFTDPTDPSDFDFSVILTSIEVSPQNSVLVYNTIDGETSLQLSVTGTLADGSTLNLTSSIFGTSYTSSDIEVVSFGAIDGQLFAGVSGVAAITVDVAGLTKVVHITVETFTPRSLGFVNLPGFAHNVKTLDAYAYIASGDAGIVVLDISNPKAAVIVTALPTGAEAFDLVIRNDVLYVADGSVGIKIYSLATPRLPNLVGHVDTHGVAQDLTVTDGFIYVGDGAAGVQVVDARTLSSPVLVATGGLNGLGITVDGVDAKDNLLVAVGGSALHVLGIQNPRQPELLSSYFIENARGVKLDKNNAHVAGNTSGYVSVDLSDPTNPIGLSNIASFFPVDVAINNNLAFFSEVLFVSATPYVNIEKPGQPVFQGFIDHSQFGDYDGRGLDVTDQYVYMTAAKGCLHVYI